MHLKGPKCARRRFLSNRFRPVEVFSGFRLGLQCVHLKGPKCARRRKCRIIFSSCRSIFFYVSKYIMFSKSTGNSVVEYFSEGVIVEYLFPCRMIFLDTKLCTSRPRNVHRTGFCRIFFRHVEVYLFYLGVAFTVCTSRKLSSKLCTSRAVNSKFDLLDDSWVASLLDCSLACLLAILPARLVSALLGWLSLVD